MNSALYEVAKRKCPRGRVLGFRVIRSKLASIFAAVGIDAWAIIGFDGTTWPHASELGPFGKTDGRDRLSSQLDLP